MKKIIRILVILLVIIIYSSNICQASKIDIEQLRVVTFDSDLFGYNYSQLYDVLEQYEIGKKSLDDCIKEGLAILNTKEKLYYIKPTETSCAGTQNTPMKFIAFIYNNYDKLSLSTKTEFKKSYWDLSPYLNRIFSVEEIETLEAAGKNTDRYQKGKKIKCYNLIQSFKKLVDSGHMTISEAAVHMVLIERFVHGWPKLLPVKYNFNYSEYWEDYIRINNWIYNNFEEIKKDKKAYRAIQILTSSIFKNELINYHKKQKRGAIYKEDTKYGYLITPKTDNDDKYVELIKTEIDKIIEDHNINTESITKRYFSTKLA